MRELQPNMSPDEILEKFKVGNKRFLEGKLRFSDILVDVSREYACKVSGSKLILIMGHSDCGAVKAAVDDVKLGNITPMLANLKPAVESVAEVRGQGTSKDNSFVAQVAKQNVLLNMEKILQNSPIIAEMVANGEVKIAGCMYDLETGVVDFYD